MDEFIAKLTNLGYEMFGVILPGIVVAIFITGWWFSLGSAASLLSFGYFQHLTLTNATEVIKSLNANLGIGAIVPGLVIAYFLGHILLWVARSGKVSDDSTESICVRLKNSKFLKSLLFRIPKPPKSYDDELQPLYEAVAIKFSRGDSMLTWRLFYPVVKSYLSRNLASSLVATYQNKYTLHRSIATAAAGLFWLSSLGFVGGWYTFHFHGISPHWGLLAMLFILALALVWGFSASYTYHWKMFGNTIITEAYSIIYGDSDVRFEK